MEKQAGEMLKLAAAAKKMPSAFLFYLGKTRARVSRQT